MKERRGMCGRHYQQVSAGKPITVPVRWFEEEPCPVVGCTRTMKTVARLCKPHQKVSWRYSIDPDDLVAMYAKGKCDICESTKLLSIDHDHSCCPVEFNTCGKCTRGLLCRQCNSALGMAKESPERLMAMVSYLKQWSTS
jgi:hypothetical protein